MILALLGCDAPATLYPVDPCRLGRDYAAVSVDVTCTTGNQTVEATFDGAADTRVGGTRGEGWEGLGFYATGPSAGAGTVSIGHRPGALGVYASEGARSLVAGYLPAGDVLAAAPFVEVTDGEVTCDAATGTGTVRVSGLPADWVDGGVWEMDFDAGEGSADPVTTDWAPPWPSECAIGPRAWATVSIAASCDGAVAARIQFLAPETYAVALDVLGQVASVSATWTEAFSATCAGGALPTLAGSLQGDDVGLRLYTPVLTVTRTGDGPWAVETTGCGECPSGWTVAVEGLPAL